MEYHSAVEGDVCETDGTMLLLRQDDPGRPEEGEGASEDGGTASSAPPLPVSGVAEHNAPGAIDFILEKLRGINDDNRPKFPHGFAGNEGGVRA